MMDLFLTNVQLFNSHDGMEWGGLLVMCLSAVWTLILMAPIHCRGSIVNLIHLSKSLYIHKLTHLHLKRVKS